jgi:DNA-binding CsgD family transcriptional regulator
MTNGYFVERRSGLDRRMASDRRGASERRGGGERRLRIEGVGSAADEAAADFVAASFGQRREPGGHAGGTAVPMSRSALACQFLDQGGTALTDVVAAIYEAAFDVKVWPGVLTRLKELVSADVCAVIRHDQPSGRGRIEHSVGIDALHVTAYADFYAKDNIWLRDRDKFAQIDAVWTSQDLISNSRLVETEFYKYWLRPQDLFHHVFGIIQTSDEHVLYVMFARSLTKGAFWQDDVELLRRLLPTLRRGLQAGERHKRLQSVQRIALDTLDAMPIGVVLLDGGGAMLAANRFAREVLESESGLFMSAAGLGVQLSGGRLKLRDLIVGGPNRGADRSAEVQGFALPREMGRRAVTLLLVPVQDFLHAREREDPVAILFIADPQRSVEMDPRRLSRIYGLSRAEARVAALLAGGKRLDDVASSLGLTYETVRKHLKQIFAKTGTERQADLVRTLSLGPCGLRL